MTGGIHPGEICIQEGVCIQEGGLHPGRSTSSGGGLHPGEAVCIQGRGLHPGQGVCIQVRESASRGGVCLKGVYIQGSLHLGGCADPPPLIMTSSGSHCSSQHASYWNAFSFIHDSSRSRGLRGSCPPPSCKNKS